MYIALGVLGALLLAVVGLVLSSNGVNAKKTELAQVTAEADAAESKTVSLGSFQNFAQIKAQRLLSVRGLADARFDWERLVRELAHVLPADVWINKLDASSGPAAGAGTGAETAAAGPSLTLSGCAPSHPMVAVTLVRLRRLHRAEDVKLSESSKPETQAPAAGAPAAAGPAAASGGCPPLRGKPTFKFDVTIAFSALPPAAPATGRTQKVPAALGGGS